MRKPYRQSINSLRTTLWNKKEGAENQPLQNFISVVAAAAVAATAAEYVSHRAVFPHGVDKSNQERRAAAVENAVKAVVAEYCRDK